MTAVALVGGPRFYREALEEALAQKAMTVACSVESPEEAVSPFDAHVPEAILVDLSGADHADALALLTRRAPTAKIVALGVSESEALECLEAGAAGYVDSGCSLDELVASIESIVREELVCSSRLAFELARRVRTLAHAARDERYGLPRLTAREREIMALVAAGLTDKEIARRLVISGRTVKNHVHSILKKLQVPNRMQAAALVRSASAQPGRRLDLVPPQREFESVAL